MTPAIKDVLDSPWSAEPEVFSELSLRGAAGNCLNLLAPMLAVLTLFLDLARPEHIRMRHLLKELPVETFMAQLVNDMLYLAKADHGLLTPRPLDQVSSASPNAEKLAAVAVPAPLDEPDAKGAVR